MTAGRKATDDCDACGGPCRTPYCAACGDEHAPGDCNAGRKATTSTGGDVDGYCVCDTRFDGGQAPDCGVREHREKARAARAQPGREATACLYGRDPADCSACQAAAVRSLYLRADYGGEVYVECRTCGWYEDVSDLPLADVLATGERHTCPASPPARETT